MKRSFLYFLLAVAFSSFASATILPCSSAAMTVYDGAGFSCTEGNLTYSNFSFSEIGTVSPLPTAAAFTLTPVIAPGADGFQIQGSFAAPANTTIDVAIGYTVTINPGVFLGGVLSMSGFGASSGASVDIAESVCAGAAFNSMNVCPSPGVFKSLHVYDNSTGVVPMDSVMFANSPTTLGIVKDINVRGGTDGSAQVSLIDNISLFAAGTPEPASYSLIGMGLIGLAYASRKRLRK
jgi:hypothetical protein